MVTYAACVSVVAVRNLKRQEETAFAWSRDAPPTTSTAAVNLWLNGQLIMFEKHTEVVCWNANACINCVCWASWRKWSKSCENTKRENYVWKAKKALGPPNYRQGPPTLNGRMSRSEKSVKSAGVSVGNYSSSIVIHSVFWWMWLCSSVCQCVITFHVMLLVVVKCKISLPGGADMWRGPVAWLCYAYGHLLK